MTEAREGQEGWEADALKAALAELDALRSRIDAVAQRIRLEVDRLMKRVEESRLLAGIDPQEFSRFLRRPIAIIPASRPGEYIIAAPKWLRMSFGYLEWVDETYCYYRASALLNLIFPLPDFLRKELRIPEPPPVRIVDGLLVAPPEKSEEVGKEFGKFIVREVEPGKFQIKPLQYFEMLAALVRRGILPYTPRPVDPADIEPPSEMELNMLYDWQRRAWREFLETGSILLVWPPNAGKSWFMAWVASKIKGRILVIVPNRSLAAQWREYLRMFDVEEGRFEVITYSSAKKYRDRSFTLLLVDEAQHISADTWAVAAAIPAKYRICGTATPYREDGREDYIIAFSGKPVTLTLEEMELALSFKPARFIVHLVRRPEEKLSKVREIIRSNPEPKTVVFSDSIELGRRLAEILETDFIYGETPAEQRLEKLRENRCIVVSRIGDMGISLKDIERVIEVSFLGSSRAQQGQRYGRLFHGRGGGEHHLIMTEEEYRRFSWRLMGAMMLGADIKVEKDGILQPLTAITAPRGRRTARARRRPRERPAEKAAPPPTATTMPDTQVSSYPPGVQKVLSRLPHPQRRLLEFLLQSPGRYFAAEELALALGYSTPKSFRESVKPSQLTKYPFFKIRKHGKKTLYGVELANFGRENCEEDEA